MPMNVAPPETVLTQLPQDAVHAWKNGATWRKEHPEAGSWRKDAAAPLCREATGTWERRAIESRITVTKGALVERFYSVGPRGSQALRRAPKWGSSRHRSVRERFSPDRRRQRWMGYWKWVAETGRDPIGEFSIPDMARCDWRLFCQERSEGVLVRYARRLDSARPLRKSTDYRPSEEMPCGLQEYCLLEDGLIHPGAINSRSDLARRFRRRNTGRIAGRQILDSERRRMPGAPGPLETFSGAFFVDVAIEERIPRERQQEALRAKAKEKIG